jgi:hypothetical protein
MVRHRRAVVVASLAVALGLGAAGRDVHVEMDPDRTLPAHHPFVVADKAIAERFGGRRVVVVALVPATGTVWSVPVLQQLAALSLDLYRAEGVRATNVLSLASPNARDIRSTEDSLAVDYLMREPPETEVDVAAIRAAYDRNPLYHGLLVSDDARAAMIFVDFWNDVDPDRAYTVVAGIVAPYRSPDLAIHVTGLPVFGHFFQEYARSVGRYFLLALAALLAVLYAAFGSIQGMLIPISTGILATACALGMVRLSGAQLDGYNVMTPILILAVGAGHSVQMLKRYYEEFARVGDSERAVIAATAKIGTVMIAAGLTAALGFLSLLTFDAPSMRAFGFFTAMGILSAVAIELTFVPALRALLPPPKGREVRAEQRVGMIARLAVECGRLALGPSPWMVPAGVALLLVLALVGIARVEVNNTVKSLLPRDSTPRRDLEAVQRHFQGVSNMTILFRHRDGSEVTTPDTLALIERFQHDLEADPLVYRTASIVDPVKRMNVAMHADDHAYDVLPTDRALLAQYLFLGYSPAFERFLDRAQREAVVCVYLRDDDARAIHRLIERARAFVAREAPPGVETLIAGGGGPIVVALNDEVVGGKIRNVIVVGLVIYTIASLVFRSLLAGLLVAAPLAVTVVVNLGTLGLFGLHLNMITASVVGMAVGIGADYAIYLLYRTREEFARLGDSRAAVAEALRTSGAAVTFVALAVSAGYAALLLSPFAVYWMLGVTVPLTMAVSCGVTITLLPWVLARWRPRFAFPASSVPVTGIPEAVNL